jgi:peptide/nickel transport system permease protein
MNKLNILYKSSVFFLLLVWGMSLLFPFFSWFTPNVIDSLLIGNPMPPSLSHFFGTDDLGRDVFFRCIDGGKISLMVSVVSISISLCIGISIGLISGYGGGKLDHILMRFVDIMMAIPVLFIILTIQVILKPSLFNIMIVIGLTSWMGVARLVRAEVKSVKEQPFILAARARGFYGLRLLFKHILPSCLNPVIVSGMLGMGSAILLESVLSFLGLGVQPPYASWGNMLQSSLEYMLDAPWLSFFPGLLITLTVLALNFIGDKLREAYQ